MRRQCQIVHFLTLTATLTATLYRYGAGANVAYLSGLRGSRLDYHASSDHESRSVAQVCRLHTRGPTRCAGNSIRHAQRSADAGLIVSRSRIEASE